MTENRRRQGPPGGAASGAVTARTRDEDVERAIGRAFAWGLPVASVIGALIALAATSIGSALLVLAAGALVGAIGLFWASVRSLSGDAPLAAGFDLPATDLANRGVLVDEKRRLLRALKDLENEHALGKIEDADYEVLVARYRQQAKAVMRSMDVEVAPFQQEAERLARDYLRKRKLSSDAQTTASQTPQPSPERVECSTCSTSNEPDAAFCKGCGSPIKTGARNVLG